MATAACARLTDLPLDLLGGGTTNLAHFRGQKLLIVFCPADAAAEAAEIADYEALADAFRDAGAWLLSVVDPARTERPNDLHLNLATDVRDAAFRELGGHFPDEGQAGRGAGAAVLIDRDGVPRHFWPGSGHAAEALRVARERP